MTVSSCRPRKAALFVCVSAALVLLTVSATTAGGSRIGSWRTFDLGVLPAHGYVYSQALGVNHSGVIVGWGWGATLDVPHRAVEWQPTQQGWRALWLGRISDDFVASDVNDDGTVVGTTGVSRADPIAVSWSGGQFTDLPGTDGGSGANAINNVDQVAGWQEGRNLTRHHAAIWDSDGSLTDLGTLGNQASEAYALNDDGEAVGVAWNGDLETSKSIHAFLWSKGRIHLLPGLPGSRDTEAYAINNTGVIIGQSDTAAGLTKPVMWRNGRISVLPLPTRARSGFASDINDSGLIVGGYGSSHVLVWLNRKALELPAKRSGNTGALAVNDSGVIVGRNGLRAAAWTNR